MTKRQIEIEKLLQWAYRDELSKRMTSSAEGIWDQIEEYGRGGINHDPGHGAAQRYSHFGLPHPDAEEIERTVSALQDGQIDWGSESEAIMGHLLGIADTRPLAARPIQPRQNVVGWWEGSRWYKLGAARARDVMMVRTLKTSALVTMHAKMGTRPDWYDDPPRPYQTRASRGSKPAIVGECWGKAAYSPGSHCPLTWDPSPISVAETRADYLAWWRGLAVLALTLDLKSFHALPPVAPEMPWRDPEPVRSVYAGPITRQSPLPLVPQRDRSGAAPVRPKGGPVRVIAITGT